MDYIPLVLGLGAVAGLITYVELTLRRERLSGLRARQSIIDRRLLRVLSAIDRVERRLDAMTVAGVVSLSPSPQPCLDCGLIGAHVANCALRMDNLVESPTDAAARRGQD